MDMTLRERFFRWLLGWCAFPKCECNLDAGEMKCYFSKTGRFRIPIGAIVVWIILFSWWWFR